MANQLKFLVLPYILSLNKRLDKCVSYDDFPRLPGRRKDVAVRPGRGPAAAVLDPGVGLVPADAVHGLGGGTAGGRRHHAEDAAGAPRLHGDQCADHHHADVDGESA